MTIEQAIEYVEKVAAEQEYFMGQFDAASGYARSGNEAIRTESAKECEKYAEEHRQLAAWLRELQERREMPEIVFCKDCARHNVDMRDSLYIEKAQECPLIHYRGKVQGHEFDYQFCAYGKRAKGEPTNDEVGS